MVKIFLNVTDSFLYAQIRNAFDKTERHFRELNHPVDLSTELEKLRENPLACMIGNRDRFETGVKVRIKFIIGIFFVMVPLLTFGAVSYLTDINITYAVYGTLLVAVLAASRVEALSERFVRARLAEAAR